MISRPPSYAPRQFADDRKTPSRSREDSRRRRVQRVAYASLLSTSFLSPLRRPAACNGLTRSCANLYAAKFIWYPGWALVPSTPFPSSRLYLPLRLVSPSSSATPLQSTAIVSSRSALGQHRRKRYQHTRAVSYPCTYVFITVCICTWMCTRGVQKAAYLLLSEPAIIT